MKHEWTPDSWKKKKALHQPNYIDKKKLDIAIKKMKKLPPLVFAGEVRSLKNELAKCVDGKVFCSKLVIVRRALQSFTQTTLEILLEL